MLLNRPKLTTTIMRFRAIILCVAACIITTEGLPRSCSSNTDTDDVCTSTKCNDLASELSKTIDPSVDPCKDFYEFACGGFFKSDSEDTPVDNRKISQDKMREGIKQLVEAGIEPNEPRPFKLVKTFYKSCMNTDAIEASGLEPFRRHLRNLGGWPLVEGDSWNGEKFDWRRPIYKFPYEGINVAWHFEHRIGYLLDFGVATRIRPRRITAVQPVFEIISFGMKEKDFDDKGSFLRTYYESIVRMAQMLGAANNQSISEIREMLSFEIKLSRIRPFFRTPMPLENYGPMTIAQLNNKYPTVPWMTYIRNFVPPSVTVTNDEIVNVPDPYYYVELEALMANTSKRVQANYVMSRVALVNAAFSTEEMREIVSRILGNPDKFPLNGDRAKYCESLMMGHLWRGATVMYASKLLDRDYVTAIASEIKSQLERRLESYNWTDEAERKAAMVKAAGLVTYIDYTDTFLNLTHLGEAYESLEFREDDFFGNINSLSNYDHDLGVKVLTEPFNAIQNLFVKTPIFVRTHLNRMENFIVIAQGSFRDKYFSMHLPRYVNYGRIGRAIGHEMTHALFDKGYYRGSDGKLTLHRGLKERPEFSSHTQCLINQYSNYDVDDKGTKADGKRTLPENIADVGGVRLAYDAYKKWTAGKPEELKLPGFSKYSAKQMFWISLGSQKCEKNKPKDMPHRIEMYDTHAIYKYRVIGSLANMPEFAEDFHCTPNSLMNPVKRCDVW